MVGRSLGLRTCRLPVPTTGSHGGGKTHVFYCSEFVIPIARVCRRPTSAAVLTGGAAAITRDNEGMVHGSEETVAFRLWPPVAIGAPLFVGWLATLRWGDPVDLGGWRVPLGWALVLLFVGWNGWSLWLFRRHETGLLPGQATHAMIEEGPYRLSRNPLYVGLLALYLGLALLAPTFWGLALFPAAVLLVLWGAIRPEERFLHERFGAPYDDYTRRVRRWL
jgi:protein-S-isoprenylcysteine O-methyltransferase Ste14